MDELFKKIATDFFRYWWNTSGNNTDQGFDDWWKLNKDKYIEQPCAPVSDIDYSYCRKFVNEWLWNAEQYGDKRVSESFNLEQCRDAAYMIERFIKLHASQSQSKPVKPEPGKSAIECLKHNSIIPKELSPMFAYHLSQAMEEYASQYRNQPSVQDSESPLTDEDIKGYIKSLGWELDGTSEVNDMLKVGKAVRDKQIKGK